MSALARCPHCERFVRVNNGGTLERHDRHGVQIIGRTGRRRRTCAGSGRLPPAEDVVAVQTTARTRTRR